MRKVTINRNISLTISSDQLKVGDKAPDFSLSDASLSQKKLQDFSGVRVINVFPSIDTPVCESQVARFIKELSGVNVSLLNVSVDLPFALSRWCNSNGHQDAITLSDYYDNSFGRSYGVLIDENHLLARSLFVIDSSDRVVYIQSTDELTESLNFDSALIAIKSAS